MVDRYANMEEDGEGDAVEECIAEDAGEDDHFLDIVDNFEGMSEGDDEDLSFVSMGGIPAVCLSCLPVGDGNHLLFMVWLVMAGQGATRRTMHLI